MVAKTNGSMKQNRELKNRLVYRPEINIKVTPQVSVAGAGGGWRGKIVADAIGKTDSSNEQK